MSSDNRSVVFIARLQVDVKDHSHCKVCKKYPRLYVFEGYHVYIFLTEILWDQFFSRCLGEVCGRSSAGVNGPDLHVTELCLCKPAESPEQDFLLCPHRCWSGGLEWRRNFFSF